MRLPLSLAGSGDVGWPIGAALAEGLKLPELGPPGSHLDQLLAYLLPHKAASQGRGSNGGGGLGALGALGLGVGLTLLWGLFLVGFVTWCGLYVVARSVWRAKGGVPLLPLASRARQQPMVPATRLGGMGNRGQWAS